MINAHESGSNSPGSGTLSRELTKTNCLQCRDFTLALHMEKLISLLFHGPRGDMVVNDWCIMEFFRASLYVWQGWAVETTPGFNQRF